MSLCISHLVGCRRGLTLGIKGWEGVGMLQLEAGSVLCQYTEFIGNVCNSVEKVGFSYLWNFTLK